MRATTWILWVLVAACGGGSSADPSSEGPEEVKVSADGAIDGCKLKAPVFIGNDVLNVAVGSGILFGGLELDQPLLDPTFAKVETKRLALQLFKIMTCGDQTNFIGARFVPFEQNPLERQKSVGFLQSYRGGVGIRSEGRDAADGVTLTFTRTEDHADGTPRVDTLAATVKDQHLTAVRLTMPVMENGVFSGEHQTVCILAASPVPQ